MRRLLWLLLLGCSSPGNSIETFRANSSPNPLYPLPDESCVDGPLTDFSYCPPQYFPATDGPEQICRPWDIGFKAGSVQGYGFIDNDGHDHAFFECTYDPSSGALVGISYQADENEFNCWQGASVDADWDALQALTPVQCSGNGTGAPAVQFKR